MSLPRPRSWLLRTRHKSRYVENISVVYQASLNWFSTLRAKFQISISGHIFFRDVFVGKCKYTKSTTKDFQSSNIDAFVSR